jgi:hypothetical protein
MCYVRLHTCGVMRPVTQRVLSHAYTSFSQSLLLVATPGASPSRANPHNVVDMAWSENWGSSGSDARKKPASHSRCGTARNLAAAYTTLLKPCGIRRVQVVCLNQMGLNVLCRNRGGACSRCDGVERDMQVRMFQAALSNTA